MMQRVLCLLAVAMLAACVVGPSTSDIDQSLCSAADQDAGLCDGPAGGWAAFGAQLRTGAAAQYPTAQQDDWFYCERDAQGYPHCKLTLWLGGYEGVLVIYDCTWYPSGEVCIGYVG